MSLIQDKQAKEKLFDFPTNTKQARLVLSNEIRKNTKALELPQSGRNHEFRKYHCHLQLSIMFQKVGPEKKQKIM